ncbi:NAD(P)/FAD-dependent oxidoreductase [Paraglaciecola aestuariivivens]
MKIAVIGAGITGSLFAYLLKESGHSITVFEKARGCGGRVSTKRGDWGQADIGATIVPCKSQEFRGFMQSQCDNALAINWPQKIARYSQLTQEMQTTDSADSFFVFQDKMNSACHTWLAHADCQFNSAVTKLAFSSQLGWQLKVADKWLENTFDKLVVTAPWPQVQKLISNSSLPFSLANLQQNWSSCWSVVLKVDTQLEQDLDLVYLKHHQLQTLVCDSAKPNRPLSEKGEGQIWVAQLAHELSEQLTDQGKEAAMQAASRGFSQIFNHAKPKVRAVYAHYWRFARPEFGQPALGIVAPSHLGFYAGGDWSHGASVEAAFQTAKALAGRILANAVNEE